MPEGSVYPRITMELDGTGSALQKFIANTKLEDEWTEEYLILFNFAEVCAYSEDIQPDLMVYLLPFYFKNMEQALIYKNRTAIDVYLRFNQTLFCNQENVKYAIGEKSYEDMMEYYRNWIIKSMEIDKVHLADWVSLFNTTVAFRNDNICQLFQRIFSESIKIKFAFFQYLSVFLFKESDNLLAVNEERAFWTNDIWDFDGDYALSREFFWSGDIIEYFDKQITQERIEVLFREIKPLLCNIHEAELVDYIDREINQSFASGFFNKRKAEYLQKMSCKCKGEKDRIWNK